MNLEKSKKSLSRLKQTAANSLRKNESIKKFSEDFSKEVAKDYLLNKATHNLENWSQNNFKNELNSPEREEIKEKTFNDIDNKVIESFSSVQKVPARVVNFFKKINPIAIKANAEEDRKKEKKSKVVNLNGWIDDKVSKAKSFSKKYFAKNINNENNKEEKVNHHYLPNDILSEEELKNRNDFTQDEIEKMKQKELDSYGYNSVYDLEKMAKEENIPFKLKSWEIGTPEGKKKIDNLINTIKNRIETKYSTIKPKDIDTSFKENEEIKGSEESKKENTEDKKDSIENIEEAFDMADEKVEEAMDTNPEIQKIKARAPGTIKKAVKFFRKMDLALGRADKRLGKHFAEKKAKKEKEKKEKVTERNTKKESVKNQKQKESNEDFEGREYFDKDFQSKDKRNVFQKTNEKRKLNTERKKINNLYEKRVKNLNENYFSKLLGEERLKELKNLGGEERKKRESEMINEIVVNIKNPLDKVEILEKLKLRNEAEKEINDRREKIKGPLQEMRDRKRFKEYLQKDVRYYEEKIEELKERNLPGDKEHIKRLKGKLKALGKVEVEKDNPLIKFSKERLKKRKENFKSSESQNKLEKIKKGFTESLNKNGKGALAGIWGFTLGAIIKSAEAGVTLGSLPAALTVLVKEMGTNFVKTVKSLLLFLGEMGLATGKIGKRYLIGK